MLRPWREIAAPHEDVLKGTFQQAEFAADLSRVHDGSATPEYQDPVLFFERTFITEGMRLLLDSVVKRLTGRGGDPVIQLQTAFGGGKTHTMLAVYHLARGEATGGDLSGIPPILDAAGVTELPRANIVVLDGNKQAPNMPQKRGATSVRTLWGELAWQLGGEAGYARIREADESGTSPGKEILTQLLSAYAPCVVLIDELVAYVRQFEEGKTYTGGSYDSNLSFIQALTEALKAVPTAVLLAALPESEKEAGSHRGTNALRTLEHYFARVQALWKPVATEEAFEIVRRRLFSTVHDTQGADDVCRAFAEYYISHGKELPQETQESRYLERLRRAYPIHPEVFVRLYEDWSTLENFQRTRGVLKLMAKVIHRLWKDGNNDLLILPGSFPLYDADTRNEAIYYLPQGWDPVLERDIDGERSETSSIESSDTRLGSVQACRRCARTIFLGSAPATTTHLARGIEKHRVLLGCVQPGQQMAVYSDALKRLTDRLHYLNLGNDRYWFDTRPNLRREMEERKRRFNLKEEVIPEIRKHLQKALGQGVFGGVHVFTSSADVPDDHALRLVVLPPDATYAKTGHSTAVERASGILKSRGEQPRLRQNRLLFLAGDADAMSRLKDHVRSVLAWDSIVKDVSEGKLNLDQIQSRQARKALEDVLQVTGRMLSETFKWLLSPMQEAQPGKGVSDIVWEPFLLNTSAPDFAREIARVLEDSALVHARWAAVHLRSELKKWFWKDDAPDYGAMEFWHKSCQYLYLPRLLHDRVLADAITQGTDCRDFFGIAQGKEDDQYLGFSFGKPKAPTLDGSLLLIEPAAAAAYSPTIPPPTETRPTRLSGTIPPKSIVTPTGEKQVVHHNLKHRFFGQVDVEAIQAKARMVDIVDEVLLHFSSRPGMKIRLTIDLEVDCPGGFDEALQRTVRENCNSLGFRNSEFEE